MIIAGSLVIFNLMSLGGGLAARYVPGIPGIPGVICAVTPGHRHQFSLYFLLPYLGTSLGLLAHNWWDLFRKSKEICIVW